MLRFHPIANAAAAESYYAKSDGGYYHQPGDLRQEWVGKGAAKLGLTGAPDFEQFKRLIHGLDPNTGEQLTAKLIENRIPGWDVTASIPKGATIALERGDAAIQDALWEAVRETVADLERYTTTRVRKGGKQEDRLTGNLVGYAVEHAETRPAKEDGMPDPDRHVHVVLFNLTFDEREGQWKAVKFRPIMDERKFFDRRFDLRFSRKLAELGYGIETKYKPDKRGGQRYYSWDIAGMPSSVVSKFSRRTAEVEKLAADLGIDDAQLKDKLGATSRQQKRKDLTLDDCRRNWDARVTPEEARQIAELQLAAIGRENPPPENTPDKAMEFAIGHHFERNSVVDWNGVAVTAMERCMGAARPEDIEQEARRQGVLFPGSGDSREVTTADVLAEESRIIAFANAGRGVYQPLGSRSVPEAELARLSVDQRAVVRHIWQSTDQVIVIEGDAGTGKTEAMKLTIPGIDKPGVFLAPSASASRGTLREKGFSNADTVARFLTDKRFREQARDGYIYIDEAPLASLSDIDAVFRQAKDLNARVILQGDRKQHKSVQRGNLFEILERFAGITPARLTRNWRQQTADYKSAVDAIAAGDILAGYDKLAALGWVKQTPVFDRHAPLVADYLAARDENKSALIVAPTHAEGDDITALLRTKLKERGDVDKDEQVVEQLRPLGWTEAEKGDRARYSGEEVLQLQRKSGSFSAGARVSVANLDAARKAPKSKHFSVYRRDTLALARGDVIRITANGKDISGWHKLNNGSLYTVAGFTPKGDIALANGWVISRTFGHLAHGYVSTSYAAQGRTVDRVLIALGSESRPAISAEQWYVSVSRARERATVYTSMSPTTLRAAIQKQDTRKSATEMMSVPSAPAKPRRQTFMDRMREVYAQWREKARAIGEATLSKERESYAR
jgi:conjugative relaxase-like TrwC/TraI family protein